MERLDFTNITYELSNLPASKIIELSVFSTINSLTFYYICSVVDALFILSLFKDDYEFTYYLK